MGNKCTVVNTSSGPKGKCVCDTPTYAVDSAGICVPNRCEALNACPQDVGCTYISSLVWRRLACFLVKVILGFLTSFACSRYFGPGLNEPDSETGKPFTCIYEPVCDEGYVYDEHYKKCVQDEPSCDEGYVYDEDSKKCVLEEPSCDEGYVYDEYYKKCVLDPCEDDTCNIGERCVLTHSGSIPTDCVCDTPTYVFSSFDQACVPNTCDAPNVCPDDAICKFVLSVSCGCP